MGTGGNDVPFEGKSPFQDAKQPDAGTFCCSVSIPRCDQMCSGEAFEDNAKERQHGLDAGDDEFTGAQGQGQGRGTDDPDPYAS